MGSMVLGEWASSKRRRTAGGSESVVVVFVDSPLEEKTAKAMSAGVEEIDGFTLSRIVPEVGSREEEDDGSGGVEVGAKPIRPRSLWISDRFD